MKIWILFLVFLIGCSSPVSHQLSPPFKEKPEAGIALLYVPGFGETGEEHDNWPEFKQFFKNKGYDLKVAIMPRFPTIDEGSSKLLLEIERHFSDKNLKFHIIAKSKGGLSARQALQDTKSLIANRVMSLSTISTPHLGTEIVENYIDSNDREWCFIPSGLAESFSLLFEKLGLGVNRLTEATLELSPDNMKQFNQRVKDVSGIEYFSFQYKIDCGDSICQKENKRITWINSYPTNPLSACLHDIIYKRTGEENDGIVTVSSATWGTSVGVFDGEHIALTLRPSFFNSLFSTYKNKEIWTESFGRVLDNLNERKAHHPNWQ